MGSGVAKQVKEQFPKAFRDYQYSFMYKNTLGTLSGDSGVVNLHSQEFYGSGGKRYTNYGALAKCLSEVKDFITLTDRLRKHIVGRKIKIGVPYKMSSDKGGADWIIVLELVEHLLGWADVYVYSLEDLK